MQINSLGLHHLFEERHKSYLSLWVFFRAFSRQVLRRQEAGALRSRCYFSLIISVNIQIRSTENERVGAIQFYKFHIENLSQGLFVQTLHEFCWLLQNTRGAIFVLFWKVILHFALRIEKQNVFSRYGLKRKLWKSKAKYCSFLTLKVWILIHVCFLFLIQVQKDKNNSIKYRTSTLKFIQRTATLLAGRNHCWSLKYLFCLVVSNSTGDWTQLNPIRHTTSTILTA